MDKLHNSMEKSNGRYREYLLSAQNIYHAIYSLQSYIFEFELLEKRDKELYYRLQDKFDEEYIKKTIKKVRTLMINLIEQEDCFIEVRVYFRPKKLDENGEVVFRPLHTTDVISQIAIVAMLHLLIYEIPVQEKLHLSDVSRLIPRNFYGNRVSLKPEMLFKPWKQQYQAYTQNTNDALKKYHTSLEYKYEVGLDLENFFPTIDPMLVYQLLMERLPVNMEESDKELMKRVLIKLLFCKLKTKLSDSLIDQYYKMNKDGEKYSSNERFVRGIPQGLPQSYFLGNICMIPISEIFQKEFQGVSYFYVDDSVIFTNDVKEKEFGEQLEKINQEITEMEAGLLRNDNEIFRPKDAVSLKQAGLYGIKVHCMDEKKFVCKSSFTRLDLLDESEVYLKCVSRQVSQAGSEFYKMYSDEEDVILERRMGAISDEVQKKIKELDERLEELKKQIEKDDNQDVKRMCAEKIQSFSKFRDRWIRYYRFFEYRKQYLSLRRLADCRGDYGKKPEQIKLLEDIIYGNTERNMEPDKKLKVFMQSYNENIWDSAVAMYCEHLSDKKKIANYIMEINQLCFCEKNKNSSYLYKQYEELINHSRGQDIKLNELKKLSMEYRDPYKTLKNSAVCKMKVLSHKHYKVAEECVDQMKAQDWGMEILKKLLSEDMINIMEVVNQNTQKLLRMVANAVYSHLFGVEIEDCFVVRKFSRKALSCGEFRILLFLRNSRFTEKAFLEQNILLSDTGNKAALDYTIMEVIDIFRAFVADPVRIDKLVLTHQYICEVWKNGSKHLYFYTFHNQEHAIALIRNIVKLVHGISFLKISILDFYILFLACYLHDISMVKIPALDGFLTDTDEGDKIAWEQLSEIQHRQHTENGDVLQKQADILEDISQVKKWMTETYKKMDGYYERKIRVRHAADSAAEIRTRDDLAYLDETLREFVAEISEAHQADEKDIYFVKSAATDKMLSLKFDKILLRLADLLDMSNCRISRPILHHNLDQMSEESAFHWISHLLTQGYELETEYEIDEKEVRLTPKSIVEKLVFTVNVDMSQMSRYHCGKHCENVKIESIGVDGFELKFGDECENGDEICNFLCRWFSVKNEYLIREFFALQEYLNRVPDNYFGAEVVVRVKIANRTSLDAKQFEVLENYLK